MRDKVYISWWDSEEIQGWADADDIDAREVTLCHTLGWHLYEDEHKIVITSTYSESGILSPLSIPKCSIKSYLRNGKKIL